MGGGVKERRCSSVCRVLIIQSPSSKVTAGSAKASNNRPPPDAPVKRIDASGTTERGRKRQRHLLRRRPYGACVRGRGGSYEKFGRRRPFSGDQGLPQGPLSFLAVSMETDEAGTNLFEKKKEEIDKRKRFVFLSAFADLGLREQLSVRKREWERIKTE